MRAKAKQTASGGLLYRLVIKDYFLGFFRDINPERLGLLIAWGSIGAMFSWRFWSDTSKNWLAGLPVVFAVLSGAFHNVSLPYMMYLAPFSKKQREAYIQKSFYVKIAVPMLFAGLCDIAAALLGEVFLYGLVLQFVTVFCVTYICGMLWDDMVRSTKGRTAYGNLKDIVEVPLVLCQIGGSAMFAVCIGPISEVEFWIIFLIEMVIMLPVIWGVRKNWKAIRRNFADYEKLGCE